MAEYFEVYKANGEATGIAKKREDVHRDGDYHTAVFVCIVNSRNEVLIQKRASCKDSFPDLWDISVGGHVEFGETAIEASLREVEEELGLVLDRSEFQHLYKFTQNLVTNNGEFINNEFIDVYAVEKDIHLEDLKLQEEEVAQVKFVYYEEMEEKLISGSDEYVPTDYETHMKGFFDFIRERIRREAEQ